MALQFQLDTLDGLDESISKLYNEKDGKFFLDVTGHEKTEDKGGGCQGSCHLIHKLGRLF